MGDRERNSNRKFMKVTYLVGNNALHNKAGSKKFILLASGQYMAYF